MSKETTTTKTVATQVETETKTEATKTVAKTATKVAPKKTTSKKAKQKAKKQGKVATRAAKFLAEIAPQKGKKTTLTVKQQKVASEIHTAQIYERASQKGIAKSVVDKHFTRKLRKGERASLQLVALAITQGRLKKSSFDYDDLKTEATRAGIKSHAGFLVFIHNFYQTYCHSDSFTRGNIIILSILTTERFSPKFNKIVTRCLPFKSGQGSMTVNPVYAKEFATLTKIAKSDDSLVKSLVKFCNQEKVSNLK